MRPTWPLFLRPGPFVSGMQESSKYKKIVRQHVDLEIIEARVEQGVYSSTSHFNFYRDLLILFNNAIVYFSKSSLESSTAHELARLVPLRIPKPQKSPPPLQRSDSLLDKQKSTAPIIVCRKRSSVSTKPSSTFVQKPDPPPQKDISKLKAEEKPVIMTVTGTRSSRRNVNQSTGENKKTEGISSAEKKKSVVDFLKRIKKNSSSPEGKKNSKGDISSGNKKRKKEKQNTSPTKKNVGRPANKTTTTTEITPSVAGKQAKEVVTTKRQSKRPRR